MRQALGWLAYAALVAVAAGCGDNSITRPVDYGTVRPCAECHTDGVPVVPCAEWDHDTPCN